MSFYYSDDDLTLRKIPSNYMVVEKNYNDNDDDGRIQKMNSDIETMLGTGWRRDSHTNQWIPNDPMITHPLLLLQQQQQARTEDITDYLYRKGGCCFPIKRNIGSTLDIEVVIRGIKIPIALSTTRRNMTISDLDTLKYNMLVNKNDLVCTIPTKKCEIYCGKVEFLQSSEVKEVIEVRRFQYYVGDGSFRSRLGLIPTMKERGIFTHLRMKDDTFCIDLSEEGKEKIFFGEMAIPTQVSEDDSSTKMTNTINNNGHTQPSRNIHVPLIPMINHGKNRIVFPCVKINLGGKKKFKYDDPILPAILHLESPYVSIPRELFQHFMQQINESTGLFKGDRLSEPSNIVQQYMGKFPKIRFWLKTIDGHNGDSVRMSLHPEEYLIPYPNRPEEMILLITCIKESCPCIVMGNSILTGRKVTFRLSKWMAYFW